MITVADMLRWIDLRIFRLSGTPTSTEADNEPYASREMFKAIRKVVECHTACDGQKPGK
jgi:hypothetical protein